MRRPFIRSQQLGGHGPMLGAWRGTGMGAGSCPPGWRLLPRSAVICDLRSVCHGLLPFHHSGRFTGSNFHVRGTAERCASSSLSLSQHKMLLVRDEAALPCRGHPQVPRAAPGWPEAGRCGSPQPSLQEVPSTHEWQQKAKRIAKRDCSNH